MERVVYDNYTVKHRRKQLALYVMIQENIKDQQFYWCFFISLKS